MALTTQQVHDIADKLHKNGTNPTLANVRDALGGGSFTTISEAMKSWRQEHKDEQELKQVELPRGIDDRLQALGADMWQTAIDIAHERLAKEREALEVIKAKAQHDVDEFSESVKALEKEQDELLAQLDKMTDTADTALATVETVTAERDALIKSLNDMKHQLELERTESKNAQSQLAEARKALDIKQTELTANLAHAAKLEAQADSNKVEFERLSAEAKADRAELKKVTSERDKISTAMAEIKGELKAVVAERDSQKTSNESILSNNEKLTKENATLEAERKTLDKELKELAASYRAEQDQAVALKSEFEKLKTELIKAQAITEKKTIPIDNR